MLNIFPPVLTDAGAIVSIAIGVLLVISGAIEYAIHTKLAALKPAFMENEVSHFRTILYSGVPLSQRIVPPIGGFLIFLGVLHLL